mgnify:CR=1 FL=1
MTNIFLTIDVEGEWTVFPSEQRQFDVEKIISNLDILDNLLLEAQDYFSERIPITWFIRCDASVRINLGNYNGLLNILEDFIQRKLEQGDSFGIHPHLYPADTGREIYSMRDEEIEDQLSEAFASWESFFGEKAKYSRIGEAKMNNFIANQLNLYDIEIDSTALPGRTRNDNGFDFDWKDTPSKPYKPCKYDYRITSKKDENNYNFLEVPFTMIPIKGPDDKEIINRYFNLSFKHKIIDKALLSHDIPEEIVCVLHPHEIVCKEGRKHGIISYNKNSFIRNIDNLNQRSIIRFKTFKELNHDE